MPELRAFVNGDIDLVWCEFMALVLDERGGPGGPPRGVGTSPSALGLGEDCRRGLHGRVQLGGADLVCQGGDRSDHPVQGRVEDGCRGEELRVGVCPCRPVRIGGPVDDLGDLSIAGAE